MREVIKSSVVTLSFLTMYAGGGSVLAQSGMPIVPLSPHVGCPADLNEDGLVDGRDVDILRSDLDHNGKVNAKDLALVLNNFGPADDSTKANRKRIIYDLTANGVVDGEDVAIVTASFSGPNPKKFDLNGNRFKAGIFDVMLAQSVPGLCRANADVAGASGGPPDGTVGGVDQAALLVAMTLPYDAAFDLNKDGVVDTADLTFLTEAWGRLPVLRELNADLDGDRKVTRCDQLLAHPEFGLSGSNGDANGDGQRSMNDVLFVTAYRKAILMGKKSELKKAAERCKANIRRGARNSTGGR